MVDHSAAVRAVCAAYRHREPDRPVKLRLDAPVLARAAVPAFASLLDASRTLFDDGTSVLFVVPEEALRRLADGSPEPTEEEAAATASSPADVTDELPTAAVTDQPPTGGLAAVTDELPTGGPAATPEELSTGGENANPPVAGVERYAVYRVASGMWIWAVTVAPDGGTDGDGATVLRIARAVEKRGGRVTLALTGAPQATPRRGVIAQLRDYAQNQLPHLRARRKDLFGPMPLLTAATPPVKLLDGTDGVLVWVACAPEHPAAAWAASGRRALTAGLSLRDLCAAFNVPGTVFDTWPPRGAVVPAPAGDTADDRLVGPKMSVVRRAAGTGAWVWAVHIPYGRLYAIDAADTATALTVLRAVQMLSHYAAENDKSVSLVLPPERPTGPPPECGPLAELYHFYSRSWDWLSNRKRRRTLAPVVTYGASPADAADVVVWVALDDIAIQQWFTERQPQQHEPETLAALFAHCSVPAVEIGRPARWRARVAAVNRFTGTLEDSADFFARDYERIYALRDAKGAFRGLWLQRPLEPEPVCLVGDPSLGILDDEALTVLVTLLVWAATNGQCTGPAEGSAITDAVWIVGGAQALPQQADGEAAQRGFIYVAAEDERPPTDPRTDGGFAWADPEEGGEGCRLTGCDRNPFAVLGWADARERNRMLRAARDTAATLGMLAVSGGVLAGAATAAQMWL